MFSDNINRTKKVISIERFEAFTRKMGETARNRKPISLSDMTSRMLKALLHVKYSRRIRGIPRSHFVAAPEQDETRLRYVRWPAMTPNLGMQEGSGFVTSDPEIPRVLPSDPDAMEDKDPDSYCVHIMPLLTDEETSCYAVVPPQGYPDITPEILIGGDSGFEDILGERQEELDNA